MNAVFEVGDIDFPELPEKVEQALRVFSDHIAELESRFAEKRSASGLIVPAWLGHGRAGKDEAGAWLAQNSSYRYSGSTSSVVWPMVAHARGELMADCWASRHNNRKYWFQFCNLLRKGDPAILVRWLLADSDMVVGLRSKPELQAALQQGLITHAVWVDRPSVDVDPTVEFSRGDCTHVVVNDGDLVTYHDTLRKFCTGIGISLT